jgi:hypothetical protein
MLHRKWACDTHKKGDSYSISREVKAKEAWKLPNKKIPLGQGGDHSRKDEGRGIKLQAILRKCRKKWGRVVFTYWGLPSRFLIFYSASS